MDKKNRQQLFKDPKPVEKKHGASSQSVAKNNNGSMARDLEEMKKLGKEMNQMKTGSQHVEDDHLIPDPQQ
ncbi:hypothetical protein G6549_00760 [Bacillus sp. MM2020_1]|nr:hypothetical protein [Bacillus sp. MM2020_1]